MEDFFGTNALIWDQTISEGVYQFILRKSKQWCPGTSRLVITGLRSFFRFLKMRGYSCLDFAGAIPRVPLWRARNLPYYLEQCEVEKLLNSMGRTSCLEKRNYIILLLLARWGVRACEMASLTLDDLDWTNAEIIFEGKGVRRKRLPISNEIGIALLILPEENGHLITHI